MTSVDVGKRRGEMAQLEDRPESTWLCWWSRSRSSSIAVHIVYLRWVEQRIGGRSVTLITSMQVEEELG